MRAYAHFLLLLQKPVLGWTKTDVPSSATTPSPGEM